MGEQPMEPTKREFFPQLTSVRFFAALIVILYHYQETFRPYLPSPLQNLVDHGYIGVSFFFVLSGFILAANYYDRLLNKTVSKRDFWFARFSRIYPLYILSIIVFLPRFLLGPGRDPIPEQAIYALGHPVELFFVVVFALQSLGFPSGAFLNSPTWSISTEFFFYLCLPFLLPLIARIKSKQLVVALVLLVAIGFLLPFLYHRDYFTVYLPKVGVPYTVSVNEFVNQFIRMNFLARLPEFLGGVLAFRIYKEVLTDKNRIYLYVAGVLASLPFFWVLLTEPESHVVRWALYTGQALGTPFFLLLLLWLISAKNWFTHMLSSPSWILLGEASFALYLFHVPVKHFGQYVLGKVLHVDKENIWLCLGLIVFTVFLSIFMFRKVEMPCRKKLTIWYKSRRSATPGPA